MDIGTLLHEHLYTAIILGSVFEGETTVVLAGYAAHQGYAPWPTVTALAAAVSFFLDQVWYLLGRWRGDPLLARFAGLRRGVESITPRLQRHRRWAIFLIRFMVGLRTAGPVAMGMARIPWLDFVIFNALGALVWAGVFAGLGYAFGRAIAVVLGEIAHYEAMIAVAIALAGVLYWLWALRRRQRRARSD